jgi:hypothetical protein
MEVLLSPSNVNTLVVLSKVPVTLYLNLRLVADANLSVLVAPPRPKSALNTSTLLPEEYAVGLTSEYT